MTGNYWDYYLTPIPKRRLVRVLSTSRPSPKNVPRSGTWHPVQELVAGHFQMATFPEITWKALADLEYIGRTER